MVNQNDFVHIRVIDGERYYVMHNFGSVLGRTDGTLLGYFNNAEKTFEFYLQQNGNLDNKGEMGIKDCGQFIGLTQVFPNYLCEEKRAFFVFAPHPSVKEWCWADKRAAVAPEGQKFKLISADNTLNVKELAEMQAYRIMPVGGLLKKGLMIEYVPTSMAEESLGYYDECIKNKKPFDGSNKQLKDRTQFMFINSRDEVKNLGTWFDMGEKYQGLWVDALAKSERKEIDKDKLAMQVPSER